jgi:hypothetical protein
MLSSTQSLDITSGVWYVPDSKSRHSVYIFERGSGRTEIVEFSPTEEYNRTLEVLGRNFAAFQQASLT